MTSKSWFILKMGILSILISAAAVAHFGFDLFDDLRADRLTGYLDDFNAGAPFVYIGIMALAIIVSPIPSIPLAAASGMIFGPFLGGVYSLTGALIGALVSFMIARHFGRELVERIMRIKLIAYPKAANRILTRLVFFSRLIPVVSFDVVSYGAGLTKLPIVSFAVSTALGMIPFTFVYTYFGAVFFVKPWITILGGFVFLAFFIAFPYLVRTYNLFGLRRYFGTQDE